MNDDYLLAELNTVVLLNEPVEKTKTYNILRFEDVDLDYADKEKKPDPLPSFAEQLRNWKAEIKDNENKMEVDQEETRIGDSDYSTKRFKDPVYCQSLGTLP